MRIWQPWSRCCRGISAILAPHRVVEEQGLFAIVAIAFPGKITALEAEHRRVEAILAGTDDGAAQSEQTWSTSVIEVLAVPREQILKKQDGVFPAAQSTLSCEQWDRLEDLRSGQPADRPVAALAIRNEQAKASNQLRFDLSRSMTTKGRTHQ